MPKKPTAIHVLNGNPSKIKNLGENEPKPKPVAPEPPKWLDRKAKSIWKDYARQMELIGLLTEVDGMAFANLCQEQADMERRQALINKAGDTIEYTNVKGATNIVTRPEVLLVQKSRMIIKAYCAEFGLTPSARGRIEVPGADDSEDEMERILKKQSR